MMVGTSRSGCRALRRGGAQSLQSILLALTDSSPRIRASFPDACVSESDLPGRL
jgi:hypothetical protein